MSVLWFKFILGLMLFELVSILFAIVPDYGNEYMTKENTNRTSFKNFAPKLNLNHNISIWPYSISVAMLKRGEGVGEREREREIHPFFSIPSPFISLT